MNISEKIAFNYLCENGYTENDIRFQCHKSPDFITSDNKLWEVKRLARNSIYFTYNQMSEFPEHDVNVIITTNKEIICIMPYSEISHIIMNNGTVHLNTFVFCFLDERHLLYNQMRCDWLKYREEHAAEIEEMAVIWLAEQEQRAALKVTPIR